MNENKWKILWNRCNGSFYQSLEWAELKKNSGESPIFIYIEKDEMFSGGILAFEKNLLTPLGRKKILVSEGTPLFITKKDAIKVLKKFKEESKKYFYGTIAPTIIHPNNDLFSKTGYFKTSNYSSIIDLSIEEKNLFNSFKRDIKRRIKKLEKDNIQIVRSGNLSDFEDFYKIYKTTLEEGGANSESLETFKGFVNLFNKNLLSLFVAKKNNKIISGVIILHNKIYGVYNYSGSSEEGYKIQSNILALWTAMKYFKETNRRFLDLGGYDAEAKKGDKTYNINKFKERFGGKITEQPIYSTNKKYFLIRKIMKKFKFIKKFYSKQ